MGKILILKSADSKIDNERILSYSKKGSIIIGTYDDITIHLAKGNHSVRIFYKNKPITSYSFVYFRTWLKKRNIALSIALYLKKMRIPFVDDEVLFQIGDKLSVYTLLTLNNLPIPETIYISRKHLYRQLSYITRHLSYPFVMKAPGSDKGKDNYLITSKSELKKILSETDRSVEFICQKFIPNNFDYRVFITGYQSKTMYEKYRSHQQTHLNNISQGGTYTYVEFNKSNPLVHLAEKAARLCKRNIAGVDIVISSKNKRPYILEVNNAPGISAEKAQEALGAFLTRSSTN